MISERLKIDLSYLGNNNILIYPIFSEAGEKILDARVVLTEEKKNEIIENHGRVVYYSFSGEMENIPNHIINNALNKSKEIMTEIVKTDKISKVNYYDAENLITTLLKELYSSETRTIKLMKALNSYDDYTYNHSVNVLILTAVFASKLKIFTKEEMRSLLLGAFLHDVGKMKLDKQILNKNSSLNTRELQMIKRHPQLGYELVKKINDKDKIVQQVILFHHEKFNDRGYYGLPYDHLPVFPKIVSICDIFDALTTKRPYRDAVSPAIALRMIVNSINNHFEYTMISNFINMLGEILNNMQYFYGKNEICELNTKELAMIMEPAASDMLKPKIIVFCKFERVKNKINVKFYEKPILVNLNNDPSRLLIKILSNNQQIVSIKDRLLERSLLQSCVEY